MNPVQSSQIQPLHSHSYAVPSRNITGTVLKVAALFFLFLFCGSAGANFELRAFDCRAVQRMATTPVLPNEAPQIAAALVSCNLLEEAERLSAQLNSAPLLYDIAKAHLENGKLVEADRVASRIPEANATWRANAVAEVQKRCTQNYEKFLRLKAESRTAPPMKALESLKPFFPCAFLKEGEVLNEGDWRSLYSLFETFMAQNDLGNARWHAWQIKEMKGELPAVVGNLAVRVVELECPEANKRLLNEKKRIVELGPEARLRMAGSFLACGYFDEARALVPYLKKEDQGPILVDLSDAYLSTGAFGFAKLTASWIEKDGGFSSTLREKALKRIEEACSTILPHFLNMVKRIQDVSFPDRIRLATALNACGDTASSAQVAEHLDPVPAAAILFDASVAFAQKGEFEKARETAERIPILPQQDKPDELRVRAREIVKHHFEEFISKKKGN